jgi:hypothetical protein
MHHLSSSPFCVIGEEILGSTIFHVEAAGADGEY